MKCHYEVLEIPRDADEAAIKTSYKRMALRWHPDKNLDNIEEAKEQFQLVQQAYEVLSDRQERAWYDNHREQILRSADSSKKEDVNIFDVFLFFTTTCFRGYADDDNGFYGVYRHVFESIAKEDLADIEDKEDFLTIPTFGRSTSDYDEVVHPFYSYWIAYSTHKSYSWLDERVPREIRDRRILKLIEKENKKTRAKAKKERNEEVRSLVAFVRKRDERVKANVKRLQERAEENRKKQQLISQERRSEQRRSHLTEQQAEWTKFDNVREQLDEIERHLGLTDSDVSENDDSIRDSDPLLCAACNKLFKTHKAFENHERSKKHRENVQLLKDTLQKDEDSLAEPPQNGLDDENESTSSENDHEEKPRHKSKIKNRKKSKNKVLSSVDDSVDVKHNLNSIENHIDDEDTQSNKRSAKIKKKRRKDANAAEKDQSLTVNNEEERDECGSTGSASYVCVTCKNPFASKNKLFAHLKKSGHAQPL